MKQSVMCIVATNSQAESIVTRLQSAGFPSDAISTLLPDKAGTRDFAHKHSTKAPEATVAGAGAGGVLGGALGYLVGAGALTLAGLGPLIAAGPLFATLSGIAAGATVGGVVGALVGMGIPEIEAKRYEGKIMDGNILMSVHADTKRDLQRAEEIFKASGGVDICTTSEAPIPKSTKAHPHL